MSVHIRYHGRFGNHAYQYACARLFAEDNGLRLISEFPEKSRKILPVTRPQEGMNLDSPEVIITDKTKKLFEERRPPAKYLIDGYFAKPWLFHDRRSRVNRIFAPRPVEMRDQGDIVANIRLGDFRPLRLILHPKWYLDILSKESFSQLFIVADEYHEQYMSYFKAYDPIFVKTTPAEDWDYLRTFDRIICANSSFSWWACFFSRASKIYSHGRWTTHTHPMALARTPGMIHVDGPFWDELEGPEII